MKQQFRHRYYFPKPLRKCVGGGAAASFHLSQTAHLQHVAEEEGLGLAAFKFIFLRGHWVQLHAPGSEKRVWKAAFKTCL